MLHWQPISKDEGEALVLALDSICIPGGMHAV